MRNKFKEVQCDKQSDIIVLVETWLYSEEKYFSIDGYSSVYSCRDTRGGGAAVYIKSNIKFRELKCSISQSFKWICLSIDNKFKLSVLYRPPSLPCN